MTEPISSKGDRLIFKITLLLILLGCWMPLLQGQTSLDSLRTVWNDAAQADSSRLKAMRALIWDGYLYSQPDSAFELAQVQYDFAQEKENKKWMADAVNTQGVSFKIRGDFDQALEYFTRALEIRQEVGEQKQIASSMNNIGVIFDIQGDFSTAQEWYRKSLKVSEEIGDKEEIANTLANLGASALDQGEYKTATDYLKRSLNIREEIQDQVGIGQVTLTIGYVYFKQGDYGNATDWLLSAVRIYEELDNKVNVGYCFDLIGQIYQYQDDSEKALEYAEKSLKIAEEVGAKGSIARSLNTLGALKREAGEYEEAHELLSRALAIREEMGSEGGIASIQNSIATTYRDQGNHEAAIKWYNQALELRQKMGLRDGEAGTLNGMARTYLDIKDYPNAIRYGENAQELARELGNAGQISSSAMVLYQCYKASGRTSKALEMHELWVRMRDSLKGEESQRAVIRQELQYNYEKAALADSLEFAKKEAIKDLEIEKNEATLSIQRIALISALGGLLLIVALAFSIYRGKKRSDGLLLNILPEETAKELKEKGSSEARLIRQVTVLFSDFKGFTALSQELSPEKLVADLNECFSAFDRIMERHGVEKIKTIGDAYMAAGGLPTSQ